MNVMNARNKKDPQMRIFSFTHCEAGGTGVVGKAVFEPVVLS